MSTSIRCRIEDCSNLHIGKQLRVMAARDHHPSATEYHILKEAARRLENRRGFA